jgi:hypothetical protein
MGLLKLLTPDLLKAAPKEEAQVAPVRDVKSWKVDPFAFMESSTHRERPSSLSYDQLRMMSYRCDVIAAIIATRTAQVASFSDPQLDRHALGFGIQMRDGKAPGSQAAAKEALRITDFIQNCGIPGYSKDNFEQFLRKITRDSLVYDQMCFEIVPNRKGEPAFFEAIDAATVRIAVEPKGELNQYGMKDTEQPFGSAFQKAVQEYQKMMLVQTPEGEIPAKYVQLLDGTVRTTYAPGELYFGIRNPRTDLIVSGYGFSELEQLIATITSYLWAEEYNRRIFSHGSIPKGILNLKGEIAEEQMQAFRREWTTLIAGVQNSWKTPLINAEDIEYINLQGTNKDMEYMQWMQFLVRIASAVYLIDPAEINFDMPRGLDSSNPMVETSGDAKLRASKDRGLRPLLRFIERSINEAIVWKLNPEFSFKFLGIDAKSADQQLQDSIASVGAFKTLNEVRAENDLEPVEQGDVVLNPNYLGLLQQQQEMAQQEQMMELAQQDPDAALVMQGIDPKAERMKAKADAEASRIHGEAKADSERAHGQAKAESERLHGKAKADAAKKKGDANAKAKKSDKGAKKGEKTKKSDPYAHIRDILKKAR